MLKQTTEHDRRQLIGSVITIVAVGAAVVLGALNEVVQGNIQGATEYVMLGAAGMTAAGFTIDYIHNRSS